MAMSKNCVDRPVRELLGQASRRICRTGRSKQLSLHELIAWTCRSNETPDEPVQPVIGHGRPTSRQTALSKQLTGGPSARTGQFNLLSDGHVQELRGQAGPRTARTGQSEDLSDREVQAVSSGSVWRSMIILKSPWISQKGQVLKCPIDKPSKGCNLGI
ncbi:hypothetical protein PSTG_04937 [Puccinia striiformis f. sp. tritici PST-78]|uniref:Uncharacterized protein n=1 Tax=Puccinia striiformis f. sp. tritici PST-78 TaxID=1165861 RepID=A0A0L0VRA5_9BASI|nr:hypothetical protein PSTG_04937 [Puccinia striiformis f. sp. tritici PST-78]